MFVYKCIVSIYIITKISRISVFKHRRATYSRKYLSRKWRKRTETIGKIAHFPQLFCSAKKSWSDAWSGHKLRPNSDKIVHLGRFWFSNEQTLSRISQVAWYQECQYGLFICEAFLSTTTKSWKCEPKTNGYAWILKRHTYMYVCSMFDQGS